MKSKVAYCGLRCDCCPIHLATSEQDKSRQKTMRVSIAEQCSKVYGMIIQPEHINDCDGCRASDHRLFSGCLSCEIRKCASKNNIESCAYCSDYACERLKQHFLLDNTAKTRLEETRKAYKLT